MRGRFGIHRKLVEQVSEESLLIDNPRKTEKKDMVAQMNNKKPSSNGNEYHAYSSHNTYKNST